MIIMCLNKTYSKVRIGKYLSDNFPIQNGLKQGDALSPLLFNFAVKYAIRKVQENQMGLKLKRALQLLVYAQYVTLFGCNVDTMKKSKYVLIDANQEFDLEVNIGITQFVWQSRYHNAGKNHDAKI
jgi:hypothetical protein